MKKIKFVLPITFLLFFMNSNKSHAQSECKQYFNILDSVYKRTIVIKSYLNRPKTVDPTNLPKEFFDTTASFYESPYFIVLDEKLSMLHDFEGEEAVISLKKYRNLKNLHFIQSTETDLENCDCANTLFCYQKYLKGRDSIDFRKSIVCDFKGEHYTVEKRLFQFSKFLRSSDGNFLVTRLSVKEFYNPGVQNLWMVILHKVKQEWVIEKLEIISNGH